MRHRIDPLILDRAPWLGGHSAMVKWARLVLNTGLSYDKTVTLATHLAHSPAEQIMEHMARRIARDVSVTGLHHLPRRGPALIVANHPTGIADGIILHHAIADLRPDSFFFANRDVLKVLPQMSTMIAPVEWRPDRRSRDSTRQTLDYMRNAVDAGRLGVIFPSGRLAKRRGLRLFERPWMSSAASLARKFDLPVVPVHIRARNSVLFYLLDLIHPSLRDITLFHETLNKDKQPFAVTMGEAIDPADLPQNPEDSIAALRDATLRLGLPQDGPTVSLLRATRKPTFATLNAKT